MSLGEKIKQLRIKSNMTRAQLADKLNVKYTTISNYENDIRQPGYDILIVLAKYLNSDLNTLLDFNLKSIIKDDKI